MQKTWGRGISPSKGRGIRGCGAASFQKIVIQGV